MENNQNQNITEEWKSLSFLGYPNHAVSSYGNVKNTNRGYNMSLHANNGGYEVLNLRVNSKNKNIPVHQLVAKAFLADSYVEGFTVDHIDRNRQNNCVLNLRWANKETQSKNRPTYVNTKNRVRPVNKYSISGDFIAKYDSVKQAAEENNCKSTCIAGVCNGRHKSHAKFVWKYENNNEDLEGEIWKKISYKNCKPVLVSNKGRVQKIDNGRVANRKLIGHLECGYFKADIKELETGKIKSVFVHKLVLAAFKGENDSKLIINHIDGCKTNNNLENLEYTTHKLNIEHAERLGLRPRL